MKAHIFDELVRDFEPPTEDEDVVRFSPQEPVESWLQAYIPDES